MPKNTPIRIIDSQKTRAASFLGGSATAGGTTDHGLLLGLADDDHIQYLRADGTRTLTGNMLVSASVTIDGVDISAHAADANAHHTKQHSITDSAHHTVTGSQYQIVGLTSTNTLGLLTAASSPTTNQVVKTDGSSAVTLVDLTVSSDLFMTGTLDFGTNTIAEDATYLQFAGSKAVRFAQNIGNANWTLYNAGGYTTTGSISITGSAGDLTVGSNVLFVDNSQANVGINMAPDSQFALDVNGPARATYWIGPHALQLKNVLMLCHYDGRAPYETNYSGEPNGHMGQVATVSGGLIYRPGKFYKAVQPAGAVTNCVPNPSMETNVTGWGAAGGASIQRITDLGYAGTCCARLYNATNGYTNIVVTSTTAANTQYTLSAYVTGTGKFRLRMYDNVSGYRQSSEYTATSEWVRYTYTATYGAGSTDRQCGFLSTNGVEIYFDAVQLESGAAATPYCDGSLGDGHAWTGTAQASSSTRAEAKLTYNATGNISATAGTIMAWVSKCNLSHTMALIAGDINGSIDIYTSGTTINVNQRNVQALITYNYSWATDTWVHVAVTWAGTAVTLYVNGASVATGTASAAFVMPSTLVVGRRSDAQYNWGGWIDDLCILGYASPANEIRAIYESNAPVFAETSTFSFRPTPKGLLWADDEGLWMKDTAANPVFGIYGGDATKSWGGFTMAPGDLLIGNNAVGSSAILWDQSAGTFGFYGAGNTTPQVNIATDGSITAGAGALALNSSGIQITAPSTQSAVGSYKFLVTGKTITSGLSAYYNSGTDTYYCGTWSNSSNIGNITTGIDATIGGGGTVKIIFGLTNSLSTTSTVYTLAGGNIATWWFGGGGTNYVGINTAAAPTRALQVAGGLFAGGEETGLTGYTQLTNAYSTTQSTGVGTVKMTSTTNRNNDGFIKVYLGTTAYWIPFWGTIN